MVSRTSVIEYLNGLIGKVARDDDGAYGVQCVDIAKRYALEAFGYKSYALGNGMDVACNFAKKYGWDYIKYFSGIRVLAGDVVSFHSSSSPSCGHVAIAITDSDDNGYFYVAEQWNGCGTIRKTLYQIKAPVKGVSKTLIGLARATAWNVIEVEPAKPAPETPAKEEPKTSGDIKPGSTVQITNRDAYYYNSFKIPQWVINKKWIVGEIRNDRVVLRQSTDGQNDINSPVYLKDLKAVV